MTYSKNINALQILRALAALMVVVWHSHLAIRNTIHNYWIEGDAYYRVTHYPAFLNHLDFGVDIFFCISGFIMYMLIERLPSSVEASSKFLLNRAIRILPPYWFFSVLVVVAFVVSKGNFNVGHLSGEIFVDTFRFLSSIFLLPQQQPPILGVGWTLVHESLFYVICGLVVIVGLSRRLPEVLASLSVVAVILAALNIPVLFGYAFSTFYIEFFFGALAYRLYKTDKITAFPILTILAGLGCYLLVCIILDSQIFSSMTFITRQLGGGLVGLLLISGLIGADKKYAFSTSIAGGALMRIGDASYTLYLMHWFVLSILGKIIGLFPGVPLLVVAIWHMLSIAIAIAIAVFLAEHFELPFHRWLSQRVKSFCRMDIQSANLRATTSVTENT